MMEEVLALAAVTAALAFNLNTLLSNTSAWLPTVLYVGLFSYISTTLSSNTFVPKVLLASK